MTCRVQLGGHLNFGDVDPLVHLLSPRTLQKTSMAACSGPYRKDTWEAKNPFRNTCSPNSHSFCQGPGSAVRSGESVTRLSRAYKKMV